MQPDLPTFREGNLITGFSEVFVFTCRHSGAAVGVSGEPGGLTVAPKVPTAPGILAGLFTLRPIRQLTSQISLGFARAFLITTSE